MSTAACISNDRVSLGMGMGWMREEFEQTGQDFESRGKRANEMIDVLRKLWAGGWVEHHGTYYDFDALRIDPVPGKPVPILIGGDSHRGDPSQRPSSRTGGSAWTTTVPEGRGDRPEDRRAPCEIVARGRAVRADRCAESTDRRGRVRATSLTLGVTSLMVAPAMFTRDQSPQGRLDGVRRFADDVLAKLR